MYRVERQHEIILNGEKIVYKTICQDNPVKDPDGNEVGTVFSYEYIRTDVEGENNRPVIFAYNGGPGSSGLWLHLGLLAPMRVKCDDPLSMTSSGAYTLENNPLCLLDICDIVVLDPVDTGYGLVLNQEKVKSAFGFENDAASIASVIEHWVIEHGRYDSKKYLMAESYGTNRSTAVANILLGGCTDKNYVSRGISIDGILNLGSDISVERFCDGDAINDFTENLKILPTYAATAAFYESGTEADYQEKLNEAFAFCADSYVRALYLGQWLPLEERKSVVKKLSKLTGLAESYIDAQELRIHCDEFLRQYKDKGWSVSPYDTRFSTKSSPFISMRDCVSDDGMMARCMPGFLGAFHRLEKELLGIDLKREYKVINFTVNWAVEWKTHGENTAYTSFQHMQRVLNRNSDFRVFFATGAYDLITPVGNVRFTASRWKASENQIIIREYPSGHMPYIGEKSSNLLKSDIRAFIKGEEIK